jgi:hypothetical protein
LIDPGSEWRLHRQWYEQSDLLGEDFDLVQKDNLYRCLDKLLTHKTELFSFRQRWKTLFQAEFEVLLYDLTSTYFECDPPEADKRRHGYSRDKRSDCVQVVIALIVTPDGEAGQRFRQATPDGRARRGLPLAYEVMAGALVHRYTVGCRVSNILADHTTGSAAFVGRDGWRGHLADRKIGRPLLAVGGNLCRTSSIRAAATKSPKPDIG